MNNKLDEIAYELVLSNALASPEKLKSAYKEAQESGMSFVGLLAQKSIVTEEDVAKLIAKKFKLEYINLKNIKIDKPVIDAVPYKFTGYYKFVPLKIENKIMAIAVTLPLDIKIQDELRLHFGYDIQMFVASQEDILETLNRCYGLGADTIEKILARPAKSEQLSENTAQHEVEKIDKLAEDASVIKLVNEIIMDAYKKRATDIHIEPYRGEFKLRYRIDGVLYDALVPAAAKRFIMSILSRFKIMANLNIVERRLPQDGRAIVKTQEQMLDLRVSFMPTPNGESLVIRILPTKMLFDLRKLGLSENGQSILEGLISKPHGIIFVTGPTGSGKTTTLYTCLTKIDRSKKKIITIEDPIEYEMPDVVQIQVMPEIGLTFARGLRSILRHDPDVIMVGEVRDLETAEIAIRVALTGHLVFSTLHTNDAASGVTRLIDIGVEPYLIASSVQAFIAQRLVRVLCPFCKKEDSRPMTEIKGQIARTLNISALDSVKVYKSEGCQECNFTGFRGRTSIYEILLMNEEIREEVLKKPSADSIKKLAVTFGMQTLRQDGWGKVVQGITTPEEILNVTSVDDYKPLKTSPEQKPARIKDIPELGEDQGKQGSYPNKRLFFRLDTKIPVHWKILPQEKNNYGKKAAVEFMTLTKNIGAGGMFFISRELVPISAILELKIELPDDSAITCLARVLRVEEYEIEQTFRVAVCFLDLSGSDRGRINKFVTERIVETGEG